MTDMTDSENTQEPEVTPEPAATAAADPTQMVKVNIYGEEAEVPLADVIKDYQAGEAIKKFEARKDEWKAEKPLLNEVHAFIEGAKKNPDIAPYMDAIYDHVERGGPVPDFMRAQPAAGGDTPEAPKGELDQSQIRALQLQIQKLEANQKARAANEQKQSLDQEITSGLSKHPLLAGTSGMSELGAKLARDAMRGDPSMTVAQAVAVANTTVKNAIESKADAERKALEGKREFGSVSSNEGSPRVTPRDKPTVADFENGTMFQRLKDATASAFN